MFFGLTNQSLDEANMVDPAVHTVEGVVNAGECLFIVHGLTGEELSAKTKDELKSIVLKHWESNGKALAVGHSSCPVNWMKDLSVYPQMFLWLFPYGLGGSGCGNSEISVKAHKSRLLMYHDKQFQRDVEFPFAAFSHDQVQAATTGGFLAIEHNNFSQIAECIVSLNPNVLKNVAEWIAKGELVKLSTNEEHACFKAINDLDAVSGISFHPSIPVSSDKAYQLIAQNPVVSACFFHFMVTASIKHVLGVGADRQGLYGNTSAYYSKVKQQG
ncbi:hypothetical protein J132_08905 [Termitomyces sp. J132]|nr:hypothetical protein J132_08905 [Termitomyces sp. J132]